MGQIGTSGRGPQAYADFANILSLLPCVSTCEDVLQVDAEHHGPMAKVLLEDLCGNSKERYNAAQVSAKRSLQARVALWDGVMQAL